MKDILIACCDGFKGFPQAIEAVYPQTQVQLCIVHLMRNCMKYVPWKDCKAVADDLKPICQAATLAASEAALDAFAAKWDTAYPAVSQVWIRHWENVIPIFDCPMEIRRDIYTTNVIESFISPAETLRERLLRKVIKTKAVFPSEDAVFRLMYLAMSNISKKWNRPIKDCGATPRRFAALGNAHQDRQAALSHFAILFPERFSA